MIPLESLIQFLRCHPDLKVFWAEKKISSVHLHQKGVNLKNITSGWLGDNMPLQLKRVFQSRDYQVIVAPNSLDEKLSLHFEQLAGELGINYFVTSPERPLRGSPLN